MGREARRRQEGQREIDVALRRNAELGLSALEAGAAIPAEATGDLATLMRRAYNDTLKQVAVAIPMPAPFMTRLDAEARKRRITPAKAFIAAAMLGAVQAGPELGGA